MGLLRILTVSTCTLLLGSGFSGNSATAQEADTFRMMAGEPRFMDPNLASDFSIFVNAQLFEPLARIDEKGELILLQAKSIELGQDGRTWTITLNPDYKWSNGDPITADDWVFSWRRILDPKTASEVAAFLSDVENADAYNKGTLADVNEVGIKATGEYTFQVVTTVVAPHFRAKLALPYLTPVPRKVVEALGDKWTLPENIVTNGPYRLVARVNDQSISMAANPSFGGKKPALGKIEITIASGDLCTAQLRAYEAGEIDMATCVPTQDIPRVKADADLSRQLLPYPIPGTTWAQYDLSHAPWNDKRVRQALSLAIDREAIVTAVSDGTAHPTATLVPESIPGSNPDDALKGTVEDARRLFAEAGFPDGKGFPSFVITGSPTQNRPLVAQLLQQMWSENLGINATINILEENAFRAWVSARKSEPYDVMISGWWSDYADPSNWFGDLITGDYRNNHFTTPEFADLVAKANVETDPAKRIELFRAANKIVEDEAPVSPLYNPTNLWLVKPYVQGLRHEGVLDFYHIEEVSFQ